MLGFYFTAPLISDNLLKLSVTSDNTCWQLASKKLATDCLDFSIRPNPDSDYDPDPDLH
jgi:hypothetical protein